MYLTFIVFYLSYQVKNISILYGSLRIVLLKLSTRWNFIHLHWDWACVIFIINICWLYCSNWYCFGSFGFIIRKANIISSSRFIRRMGWYGGLNGLFGFLKAWRRWLGCSRIINFLFLWLIGLFITTGLFVIKMFPPILITF